VPVRSSRRVRVVLLLGAVAFALPIALAAYLNFGIPIEHRHVPVPPDDASPHDVLQAYFEALDANDAATQKALWVPGRPRFWPADRIRAVHELDVSEHHSPYLDPNQEAELSDYPLRAQLSAECRLEYWPLLGWSDQDSGQLLAHPWLLVRADSDHPWRIWAEGFFG
jgi:hypothetical protein